MTALTDTLTSQTLLTVCVADPDRWASAPDADPGAIAACRVCPRRFRCAQEACETSAVHGIWAGVFVPESGRARTFAQRRLRSLAEHGTRHGLR